MAEIEIWTGVECTFNRIGDEYFNQCDRNGYENLFEDIAAFTRLGIKKVREPIIWELAQGDRPEGHCDFSKPQRRFQKWIDAGVQPIAGLLHHGSGPRWTSLDNPNFPKKFAAYVKAVATAFPQVEYFTPINEPLTTARFSCLYGHWYPHARDDRKFVRAIFNQCQATILAMREIRKINPRAKLVQTDDLGRAQGTKPCSSQVAFENARRWLGFDLLTGKVDANHKLAAYLKKHGATEQELMWFVENPCPPDIIGINHYPLSNRFLDHRLDLYPPYFASGNGKINYVDVGVPQAQHHLSLPSINLDQASGGASAKNPVEAPPVITLESLLLEVHARYGLPVAVTEAHVDGPRETQLGWFNSVLASAESAKEQGADVRAVTAWSLLGSYDWNSLCTKNTGYYEPGIFDIRSGTLRATALANNLSRLSLDRKYVHPSLSKNAPILIFDSNGPLGKMFARIAEQRNLTYQLIAPEQLDVTSSNGVRAICETLKPWAVINTDGYARLDRAEDEPEQAHLNDVIANEVMAIECRKLGIPYLTFSSDMVFGGEHESASDQTGRSRKPYVESDSPSPLNVFGRTKATMERRVLHVHPKALIIRTGSFFGPLEQDNFVTDLLQSLKGGQPFAAAHDIIVSPTYIPDLVHAALNLLIDELYGIVHLTSDGAVSWAAFAKETAALFKHDPALIVEQSSSAMGFVAKRPAFSALTSERVKLMPNLSSALDRFHFDFKTNHGMTL